MSSAKWRLFGLGLSELTDITDTIHRNSMGTFQKLQEVLKKEV